MSNKVVGPLHVSWTVHKKARSERTVGGESSSGVIDNKGRNTGKYKIQIEGEYLLL